MKKRDLFQVAKHPATKWVCGLAVACALALTFPVWWRTLDSWIDKALATRSQPTNRGGETTSKGHGHEDDHGHDHGGHDETTSIELSPQARKNLGLSSEYLQPIQLSDYYRTVTIPAIVAAKPGRTAIQVSSPMIGIVQHVHAVSGEVVLPGELLFEVRLTYEDLVDTQSQLIKNLADLEIENREVVRLEEVARTGAVAQKVLLDRQYAKQKLESTITAQQAALKLHGLSDEQVETIVRERRLLRDLSIVAPDIDTHEHEEDGLRLSGEIVRPVSLGASGWQATPLVIEQLQVHKGQGVMAGEMLCTLSDYSWLYVEGKAFEQDAPAIAEVASRGWPIDAVFPTSQGEEVVRALKLVYVANAVNPDSRTLSFFVELPNTILRDETTASGERYITWKYRVGQRMQVRVPIEQWTQQIVLPIDAAVKEGADWFVFVQNGDHFDRIAVHVKYRDQQNVVIENDGAIFPGDVVAMRAAHQLQMAIKNKSGAGTDPHAGHNH